MTVTAVEFYRHLNKCDSDGTTRISHLDIIEDVKIDDTNFKGNALNFTNCRFYGKLEFDSSTNMLGVKFIACTFTILSFRNVTLKDIQDKSVDGGRIAFIECSIRDILEIKNCILDKNLLIERRSEIKDIIIAESILDTIHLNETSINHNLQVIKCRITSDIKIESSKIQSRTLLIQTICKRVLFYESTHVTSIEIAGGEIKESLIFHRANIEGNTQIVGVKTSNNPNQPISSLLFIDSSLKKECSIAYPKEKEAVGFQHILLRASSFENGLNIKGSDLQDRLNDTDNLRIDCSRQLKGEIGFQDMKITSTYINGVNSDASIIFNNTQFTKLALHNFTNNYNLQFINISPLDSLDTKLVIENSHLGKTQFASTNLANFGSILIENSNLTDISASTTKWFSLTQLRVNWPKKKWYKTFRMAVPVSMRALYLHHCRQQRELFRQLKFAMEKQGDRIQSLEFKQYEMIAYRNALNLSKGKIGERLIMWVNRSNSYGQNWWKPVLWAIGITALFYFLITTAQSPDINGVEFSRNGANRLWSTLWKNLGVFFQMLNPVHLIDKMSEGAQEINKMTYFLDYLYRIIISYLIFQTISAFRKYVK